MGAPVISEFGHSCPPEGPHTITFHVPGWDLLRRVRDGDMSPMARLTSIYPRFGPFGKVKELHGHIHKALGLAQTQALLVYVFPDVFQLATDYIASPHRKAEDRCPPSELKFRIVDISETRLYCLVFPASKFTGINGTWQDPGIIITSRQAESLLPHTEKGIKEVPFDGNLAAIPAATWLPEVNAHAQLRARISKLLHRAPINASLPQPAPEDITLYPTGMAAVFRLSQALIAYRPGMVLALGALFHNTWHLFEETPHGTKHFGEVATAAGLDAVEAWLEGKDSEDGTKPSVSYAFFEWPSNPLAVALDLHRLRGLADKFGFPLVADDTIGTFADVDLAEPADVIMTSLTKSFSGYADVMGGAITLSPRSSHHAAISKLIHTQFHNELFAGDAEQLLRNSEDYLARVGILNRNAAQLATYLEGQTAAKKAGSTLLGVRYVSHGPTRHNYERYMRRKTSEHTPGYGCLLNLEFDEFDAAMAFYDDLKLHIGPHLGAHRTLALAFNDMSYGRYPEKAAYHRNYGIRGESVRISVGLEDFEDILGPVKEGLERAGKAKAERKKKEE